MLIKAAPFLVVAHILVGVWLVELWNSGYAWFIDMELRLRVARRALGRRRVLANDLELAIAAARGARCAMRPH